MLIPGPHPFGNPYHHRYYSVVSIRPSGAGMELDVLVRRCSYIDEMSGEEYLGISSHFLCNAAPGKQITLTGPYNASFTVPLTRPAT